MEPNSELSRLGFGEIVVLIFPVIILLFFLYVVSNRERRNSFFKLLSRSFTTSTEIIISTETMQDKNVNSSNVCTARLILIGNYDNPNIPKALPLFDETVRIGRSSEFSNVVLNSKYVSKLHCKITKFSIDESFWLFDEGSVSGTYINQVEVSINGCQLESGDMIGIGPFTYQFITK